MNPFKKPFLESISRFERDVISIVDIEAAEFQRALVKVSPESTVIPEPIVLRRPYPQLLCSVICLYRLADVIYSLRGPRTPYKNPRYPKLNLEGALPPSQVKYAIPYESNGYLYDDFQYWPLSDWVGALEFASKAVSAMKQFSYLNDALMHQQNVAQASTSALQPALPLQVRLIKDLHRLTRLTTTTKLLINFQTAALHISFMLKGSDPSKRLVGICYYCYLFTKTTVGNTKLTSKTERFPN